MAVLRGLEEGAVFAERYQIVRCIAAGGMGAVYEVIHLETERHRALKVMHPHTIARDDLRVRFKQEARVAASVESEHIVDVFDAGFDEKTSMPFLVMELLRGEELGKYLQRVQRMEPDDVLMYLHQTSLALDKTHKARIVHRDLKPENLFLCERDEGPPRIKILDFGIAKIVAEGATKANATRALGTPLYMAPEQFRPGSPVSPATDIFAMGMIAYTLLVGKPYWHEEQSVSENVFAFVTVAAQGPKELATARAARAGVSLPATFDEWFVKATAPLPTDRFSSASSAVQALADALGRLRPGYGALGATASAGRPMMQSTPEASAIGIAALKGPKGTALMLPTLSEALRSVRKASASVPATSELNSAAVQSPTAQSSQAQPGRTLVATAVTSSHNIPRRSSPKLAMAIALPLLLGSGSIVSYFVLGFGKASQDSKGGEPQTASSAVAMIVSSTTAPPIEPVVSASEAPAPSLSVPPSVSSAAAPSGSVAASAVEPPTPAPVGSSTRPADNLPRGTGTGATTKQTTKTKSPEPQWIKD